VLAATNHDLQKMVQEGRFRKDLYYRLNVVNIRVPPLRDRLDDVAELANYFLFRFDRELGLDFRGFAPETLEMFERYAWPGNVRELQSAIKQAMLQGSGHLLMPEFLPEEILASPTAPGSAQPIAPAEAAAVQLGPLIEPLLRGGETGLYDRIIAVVERVLFSRVLSHTHGNQTEASEVLGLNRQTLRHKLRTLGLVVDKTVAEVPRSEPKAE
jgi:two-component system nitrogen regulation response regulator GlnG